MIRLKKNGKFQDKQNEIYTLNSIGKKQLILINKNKFKGKVSKLMNLKKQMKIK